MASVLRPVYRVGDQGYDTKVGRGWVSTWALADQFCGGDAPESVAKWMGVSVDAVWDAIRWELLPRRTRLRLVRRELEERA